MTQTPRPAQRRSTSAAFTDEAYPALRRMRAELATALRRAIAARGWSDAEAAAELHVGLPRVVALKAERWDKFTLEMLLTLAVRLELGPKIVLAESPAVVPLNRRAKA